MKIKLLGTILIAGLLGSACENPEINQYNANSNPETANSDSTSQTTEYETGVRFICRQGFDHVMQQDLPTTYALTQGEQRAIVRWSTEYFTSSGWDPQRRCEDVSPRFQAAYNNNTLNFITNGRMNNQPVLCTALADGGECEDLLITLRPEDNPQQFAQELGQILKGRSTGPLRHNAHEEKQIYIQVDIKEFIRNAPAE
jgi:hypothetical protein